MEVNKIYQGDCFEKLREIENESVDLILTDIPYNISKKSNLKTMQNRKGRNGIDFNMPGIALITPKLKKGGSFIAFHSFEQYVELKDILQNKEMELKDRVIWEKSNPMPRNRERRYISNIEMYSWYVKRGDRWVFNRQNSNYDGCILKYASESGGGYQRWHPCQKPIKLLENIIQRHSNEEDIVLDCFAGSMSTAIACINTNRKYIMIEKNEQYYVSGLQRIQEYIKYNSDMVK